MYKKNTKPLYTQIGTGIEEKNERKIVILINSIHFLLEYVFIVFEEDGYRLVVNRVGKIITDQYYQTLKGAKIAFLKLYGLLAFNDKIRAKWSHVYTPDKKWLVQRLK